MITVNSNEVLGMVSILELTNLLSLKFWTKKCYTTVRHFSNKKSTEYPADYYFYFILSKPVQTFHQNKHH